MAKYWAFYPHPSGTKRRGLEVASSGTLAWAACREGDTRTSTIFLPGPKPDAVLSSDPSNVIEISYGKSPVQGFWPVHVKSKSPGTATLEAKRGSEYCLMVATVFAELSMSIAFKKVKTEKWTSTITTGKMNRLIENLNYIYSYQGNLRFNALGGIQTVNIPGLPNVFDTDDIVQWADRRDCGADTTLFFVKETDALAVNWSDLVIMEDSQKYPWDEMTCAHEIGHRMGLPHPSPSLPSNLMNQTAVGDRHRYRIYLTRSQIETVTNKSKWKKRFDTAGNSFTCPATRA